MKLSEFTIPDPQIFIYLIPRNSRGLFYKYLAFIKLLSNHIDSKSEKYYEHIYKAVSHNWHETCLLGDLQQEFIRRNLSLSLLYEPIEGFHRIQLNRFQLTFFEAVPILMQIVSPVSRLVAVLNNQRPPFYQPFANLLFGYWVLYTITDNSRKQQLADYNITVTEENTKQVLIQAHQEISQLMYATGSLIFRQKIGMSLGIFKSLTKKIYINTENTQKKLKFIDYVNAILYGLWQNLTRRNKLTDLNKM